jgi:hypothetical protein
MPRKSPYPIVLNPDEENELLKRSSKYTLPYFTVLRAKMVLLAAQVQGIVVISPTYIKFDQFSDYLNLQRGDI